MHRYHRRWIFPAALIVAGPLPASAASFLSVEEAQHVLLPGKELRAVDRTLSAAEAKRVAELSGLRVRSPKLRLWRAGDGTLFFVDEVLGKHEFITYAVAIDALGAIVGIEILDYRETYGGQIGDAAWRRQFAGKTAAAPLKLDEDVHNISGATLSCRHVTDGVKRLLATRTVLVSATPP